MDHFPVLTYADILQEERRRVGVPTVERARKRKRARRVRAVQLPTIPASGRPTMTAWTGAWSYAPSEIIPV